MVALPTILVWMGAIGVVLATFMGHPRLDRWKVFLLLFGVLSAVGATWSEFDTWRASQELDAKNEEILRVTREAAETQRALSEELIDKAEEIQELYEQLAQKSEEIADLSGEISNNLLGGTSYPYLGLSGLESGMPRVTLSNMGEYPLYSVSFRITDIDVLSRKVKSMSLDEVLNSDVMTYETESIGPQITQILQRLAIPNRLAVRYNAFLYARNGRFVQEIRLRKVAGRWKPAYRVKKHNGNRPGWTELKVYVDPDFPLLPNGQVEW